MRLILWLIASSVPFEEIVHAASAHSGTVLLDQQKLSGTDSGAARVNTPVPPLSVSLATNRCRISPL